MTELFFDMLSYKNAIECHLLKTHMTILLTAATGGLGKECFTERISEVIYMCECISLALVGIHSCGDEHISLPVWQAE
jgi:limonene-1,2-epoxide hydrolase